MSQQAPTMFVSQYSKKKPTLLAQQTGKKKKKKKYKRKKQVCMAKQKFTHFIPREKPKKRRGVHKKSQNKNEKRQKKQTRYKGQGR